MKTKFYCLFFLITNCLFSQQKQDDKTVIVSGKIIEKNTAQPLEYATITITNALTNQVVAGGVTDTNGDFKIKSVTGKLNFKYEFISFKTITVNNKLVTTNTNVGTIALADDTKQLDAVEIRVEKTAIDIKLDKKIYTVGKDILVRGGTVSDVLGNIPSVVVDTDGAVSLRGNDNVRILIDGKPSNAININDVLKLIPADAIDKVEVVTNPSARYDAEGGGGILNIILKKGKNQGLNGTILANIGYPKNSGISTSLNLKQDLFNLFTTIGYNDRNNPGRTKIDQEKFYLDKTLESALKERRESEKFSKGINLNFGVDLFLDQSITWTHAFNYRSNTGGNIENVLYYNYNQYYNYVNTSKRYNNLINDSQNAEYTTNFTKKFKKEGHKLSIDGAFSINKENETSSIDGKIVDTNAFVSAEATNKKDRQNTNLIQLDYVLPIKKVSQFEAGFRGNYLNLNSNYKVQEKKQEGSPFTDIEAFTNNLEYIEKVNAIYTQFGSKINKFSFLAGVRYENSAITINQITTNINKDKRYFNFFPSLFLTYQINKNSSISINYSKRITRPRDRFINPFASYISNINLFVGNPDINPAYSDAYAIGFLQKWDKITLSTSAYYNHTTDSFQVVRKERGDFVFIPVDGADVIVNNQVVTVVGKPDIKVPVVVNTPFNLATENKLGFEFTLNYTPKKWCKLNGNFNIYANQTIGNYSYTNTQNVVVVQNFDTNATTWFTRIIAKINLPYKIDWQTNFTYNAPQKIAQGNQKGMSAINLAFSKDILKDKATLSFSINDLFNSRKMDRDLNTLNLNSNIEMQNKVRSIILSFTYRFNKKKTDKDAKIKTEDPEFMG